jgi:hypothetical protein
MHFDIDLSPKLSAQLTEAARARGIDPTKLIEILINENLPPLSKSSAVEILKNHFYFTASSEQFKGALDEIVRMNQGLPALSEDAFDRGSI